MMKITKEQRRSSLRRLLQEKELLRVIETVNGLEGMIAERTQATAVDGSVKAFDALWLSGLCHAAFMGRPDNGSVDISEKLAAVREIFAVTTKPLIIDLDTGGDAAHLCRYVAALEEMGVSAAVIEDKTGLKRNSLYGSLVQHCMEDADVFAEKIRSAKAALRTGDFMVLARLESLITGESTETALKRAARYVQAGADGLVLHSVSPDAQDLFALAEVCREQFPELPLVFIPTVYHGFTDVQLHEKGADVLIYANQLMRSAYLAMERTAASILEEGRSQYADTHYCAPVKTILNLIDGELQ